MIQNIVEICSGVPDKESYRVMGERSLDDVIFLGPMSESELHKVIINMQIYSWPQIQAKKVLDSLP